MELGEIPLGPRTPRAPSQSLLAFPQGQGQGPAGGIPSLPGATLLPRLPRQQNNSKSPVSTKAGGRESLPVQFSTPARAGEANLAEDVA